MPDPTDRSRVLPVDMPDGSVLHVEVLGGGGGDATAGRRIRFADLRDDIANMTRLVTDAVAGAKIAAPRRISVEFGVKLTVESNALVSVLAKVGAEASMVVRLEWEEPPPTGSDPS
ncbi:hypothetical protein GCM10023322_56560 [Rugosimonospora acidiphila]|uniref:Trypsin-co-occurring domain-containing protein n=1 Tax=Rugosimonospora acidiphila TaxID=556531 RepID=A0ABP9SC65_9ACTN